MSGNGHNYGNYNNTPGNGNRTTYRTGYARVDSVPYTAPQVHHTGYARAVPQVHHTGYARAVPQVHHTGYATAVPSQQQQQQQVYRTGYAVTSPAAPQRYCSTGYVDAEPNPEYYQHQNVAHHRSTSPAPPEPTIISGWEHSMYAHQSDRYQYLGKDEDGEPEWLDYGPKSGRR